MTTHTININQLTHDIQSAYRDLELASNRAFLSALEAEELRATMDNTVARAELDGTLEGKNQAQRQAHARELYAKDYAELDKLEVIARRDAHDKQIAALRVERVRALLRIVELMGNAPRANGDNH